MKKHLINQYFNHVYAVNLKFDLPRRVRIHYSLKKQGISFSFFSATDGYQGEILKKFKSYQARQPGTLSRYSEYNELERKRGCGFIESPGAMGYIFTYLRLLKEARAKRLERILILEDDIIFSRDFANRFDSLIGRLPNDWKVLQLGASQYHWESVDIDAANRAGYYMPRTVDTCGSFALALHSSVFDELIEAAESFETTFDLLALGEIYERHLGKCFVAYPNIVMPDVTSSHIRGHRNQFKQAELMKWRMEHFEFPPAKPVVTLLVENKVHLPNTLLRQNQQGASIYLNVYVNTPDGVRPIHHENNISDYKEVLLPFKDTVKLPFTDHCFKLTHGQTISYLDILSALEHEENPLIAAKLMRWPFEVTERIPDRVSIILSTCEFVEHLLDAIDSVLAQDDADIEILVIDNKNHPSIYSERIRAHLALIGNLNTSSDIKHIEHTKVLNNAAVKNTGIMASTGEYVCFLDGGNTYLPGRLSACIHALKSNKKEFGGIYCGYQEWTSPENDLDRYPEDDLVKQLLTLDRKSHYIHTNTVTYRFDELIKTNGFDESYTIYQDLELNLRFLSVSSLTALKESLVRLKPEATGQENHESNSQLFREEVKLLADFQSVISSYGVCEYELIFAAHFSELLKNVNNQQDPTTQLVGSEMASLSPQALTALQDNLAAGTQVKTDHLLKTLTDTQHALEISQQHLQDSQQHLSEIEASLTWRISKIWRYPILSRLLPFLESGLSNKKKL